MGLGGSYLQIPSLKRHEFLAWPFNLPGKSYTCSEIPALFAYRRRPQLKCHCICIALCFSQILSMSGRKQLRGLDFDVDP